MKSWNVESKRMLVVSKRRRRRKFIPSLFPAHGDFSASCPSNFVQNHPMSEYNEENLTVAENRDHKRPIHRPTVPRYKTRHYPLMKSVENVDGPHTRWAKQRGLSATYGSKQAAIEKAIIQFEDRDRGSRCAGLA